LEGKREQGRARFFLKLNCLVQKVGRKGNKGFSTPPLFFSSPILEEFGGEGKYLKFLDCTV